MVKEFWRNNGPDLNQALEAGEFTANTSAAVLGLAMALGVANPAVGITAASLAFASSVRKIIESLANRRNKKITLEEIIGIIAPLAYVESYKNWVEHNDILARINFTSAQSAELNEELPRLNRDLAQDVLDKLHNSTLIKNFNLILSRQLQVGGLSKTEANIVTAWVAWGTRFQLRVAFDEFVNSSLLEEEFVSVIQFYLNQHEVESSQYASIENYLENKISKQPEEPVFDENFNIEDIYVPLEAKSVDMNAKVQNDEEPFILDNKVKEILQDFQQRKQVIFIQGGPGRGKTVFCRMFADWVRQHLHPLWIPIFIRLRDIDSFEQSFAKTLQGVVEADFGEGWLTGTKLRFLFILDGFDELRMEGRVDGGIEKFINQVCSFQEQSQSAEIGHRFIITGRQLALQGITFLFDNLKRIELLEMDDRLQQQWLNKWEKVVNPDEATAAQKTEAFRLFLRSDNLPEQVKNELAREPLLLYLLAAMHRDDEIAVEDLKGTTGIQTKIRIYEKAVHWVLVEQRRRIRREIVRLEDEELYQLLMETGLCVVQSGGEYTKVSTIEQRLGKYKSNIAKKITRIRTKKQDDVLRNALIAFYIKPASGNEGGAVEFVHKSFSEFLCAKRLQQSIEKWTKWDNDEQDFSIDKEKLADEIYDFLGFGKLTPEIVEYLFGLLSVSNKFKPLQLFKRLEDFYIRWCNGKFIDAAPNENLPQKKMLLLKKYRLQNTATKDVLGIRQVDAYTGLNVMILLLELHRYGQEKKELRDRINFHPCGKHNEKGLLEDDTRLLQIIGYCSCLGVNGFLNTVGSFLRKANLSRADLSHSYLSGADLSGADLSHTKLRQAYLTEANLNKAKLTEADLCRCDLTDSNLQGAILKKAYLRGADCREANFEKAIFEDADLCRAYLYHANLTEVKFSRVSVKKANLDEANFQGADFADLIWDIDTQWFNIKGLHKTKNVPQALEKNQDFKDAKELSIALEKIELGQISDAIKICKEVAKKIEERRGTTFAAHIYNRFAWLSCLYNKEARYRNEIEQLASKATTLEPGKGNYKDTYAVALVMNANIMHMPPNNTEAEDNIEARHPYNEPQELLEKALESEDFQKFALPTREKIMQRRRDWIKKLKQRINPFTDEMISILLKEEY